ncbi:hypothetical protein DL93DRAFT_2170246 [Clavulina sp. PMI_390]|nr:hypothetical protein DL93DRAFT_2170246 [Clavulina sp. PMI_390]
MSAGPPVGPLWLEKVNFDIVFAIISWLDPLSAVRFSCSCKVLQRLIGDEATSYYQSMRDVYTKHCLAPHSFPNLLVNDLKRFSARPSQLLKAFGDPTQPLQVTADTHILDYEKFLSAGPSSDIDTTPRIEYLDPYLLPGGRWILSGIIIDERPSTHLFCWDRTVSHVDGSFLQPVAAYHWEGLMPKDKTKWLTIQLHGLREVSLAFALHGGGSTTSRIHEIICLRWAFDCNAPTLNRVARLEDNPQYIGKFYFPSFELQGDYLVFLSANLITIWNWKEDRIVAIDNTWCDQGHGPRSIVTALPPHILVFPQNKREIYILEIPNLHDVGTTESYHPIPPASLTPQPFLENDDEEGRRHYSLSVLDHWRPPALRSGIALHKTSRPHEAGRDLLISLRATAAPVFSPVSIPSYFSFSPRDAHLLTMASGPEGAILGLYCWGLFGDEKEPLEAEFFPFVEGGSLAEPIRREFLVQFPYYGNIGPLCLVSGTAILGDKHLGPQPKTQVVGISSNTVFFEEITNALDPCRTMFFIGSKDSILSGDRIRNCIKLHRVTKDHLIFPPNAAHREA